MLLLFYNCWAKSCWLHKKLLNNVLLQLRGAVCLCRFQAILNENQNIMKVAEINLPSSYNAAICYPKKSQCLQSFSNFFSIVNGQQKSNKYAVFENNATFPLMFAHEYLNFEEVFLNQFLFLSNSVSSADIFRSYFGILCNFLFPYFLNRFFPVDTLRINNSGSLVPEIQM